MTLWDQLGAKFFAGWRGFLAWLGAWGTIVGMAGGPRGEPHRPDYYPRKPPEPPRYNVGDVCTRLRMEEVALRETPLDYTQRKIPKAAGGVRTLHIPNPALKAVQKAILRHLLGGLSAHPAAFGFERGRNIVDAAAVHRDADIVVRLDIRDFFPSTPASAVYDLYRMLGYDEDAAALLTRLTTHAGGLPQGAPTSPKLSNLVNRGLDARLSAIAEGMGGRYCRYADDLYFSARAALARGATADKSRMAEVASEATPAFFQSTTASPPLASPMKARKPLGPRRKLGDFAGGVIGMCRDMLRRCGYALRPDKVRVRRRHQRQRVLGLVVNGAGQPRLDRTTRRTLRAMSHRLKTTGQCSAPAAQWQGIQSFAAMVARGGGAKR